MNSTLIHNILERLRVRPVTIPVLDHGYVRLIEHWGSDRRVIEAARQSTDKSFRGWETDEKLLKYLYEHEHKGPFELAGLVLEVKAPIMVFRQWHRHRTQSYDEMSGRYVPLPNENYLPEIDRLLVPPSANKQANSATSEQLTHVAAQIWRHKLEILYQHMEGVYQAGLAAGVPKEIARLAIGPARYSHMRCSANLRNWISFLTLREDSHAQWETQQFAHAVGKLIQKAFPRTHQLYLSNRKEL